MISLVFPTYNEQGNLEELYRQLTAVIDQIRGEEFEFIFVDDCSADRTPEILKELNQKDPRVRTIRFAKNSGSHAALSTGLAEAKGDCAIVLAADLQDPPEIIVQLLEEWKKGAQTVWGARKERQGESFSTQLFAKIYYFLVNRLTPVRLPPEGADVFLADRKVLEALKKIPEKHSSIFMAVAWLGFKQATIFYVKESRHAGKSKWTFKRKMKLAADSLLNFRAKHS